MGKKIVTRLELSERWREIEAEDDQGGATVKLRQLKEAWFSDAFKYLMELPEEEHIWCSHQEVMGPLLETFYNYSKDEPCDSPLKLLWARLSREIQLCTLCICQHHQTQLTYATDYEPSSISPLLHLLQTLDEERICHHLNHINAKFSSAGYDPASDNSKVVSVMFEVLMFPSLLDDHHLANAFEIFIEAVDNCHELTLEGHQQYPDGGKTSRVIIKQFSGEKGLTCGLQFLCSSQSSLEAVFLGLSHTLKLKETCPLNYQLGHLSALSLPKVDFLGSQILIPECRIFVLLLLDPKYGRISVVMNSHWRDMSSIRRRARCIGYRLAGQMGKLRSSEDLDPLQPLLKKCICFLESEIKPPATEFTRPMVQLERTTLFFCTMKAWSFLEPPPFEKGISDQYPFFLSLVLNHISGDPPEFSYAVRLLFEMLGCKLWLRSTLSPSVMRNTLLGQCFHIEMKKAIKRYLINSSQSLEALQDGEYEEQRRHILYFLLHQVTVSSNFSILMRKKACQIARTVEVIRCFKKKFVGGRIGVITPYRSQLSVLRSRFSHLVLLLWPKLNLTR